MTDQLPSTWTLATLEQLLAPLDDGRLLHHGWSPQCEKEPAGSDQEWGVLKTTAIQPGAFLPEHNKKLPSGLSPRPQHEVKVGDLLITCAGPRVRCGVPCLVKNTRPRLMLSGKMYRFRVPDRFVDSAYVEKYLLSQKAQRAIDAMKTGGSESGLNLTHDRFKPLPVPLAPIDEQRRIASKVDELFSSIGEGERALERVSVLVERYRQSVLKAAVTGELTRSWREKNKDTLESGEALLARLLTARREAWEKAELEQMKAKGLVPANDKWKQKYKEPVSPHTTELPELPHGWTWVSVDQIAADTLIGLDRGASEQSTDAAGRSPYIKMNNITMDGRVLFDGVVYVVASEAERNRFAVRNGDILFNTRNSKELVGKTGLVINAPAGALYNNNIMRVRTVTLVDPRYLATQMCEPTFRSRLELVKKATTNVAAVYAKDLFPLAVALPPRAEQEQIMSEVDRAVEAADHMLQELSAKVRTAAALRQSILREAFRGRLVPQRSTDESAAVLLERIAAHRGTDIAAPKRGRKKKITE